MPDLLRNSFFGFLLFNAVPGFTMRPNENTVPRRIDSLQAGRAIAALFVVAHHSVLAARDFSGFYIPAFEYGWLGVDFFFVLSGFIIAFSIEGKSIEEYAWHRLRRVMLPYWPIGIGIATLYTVFPGVSAGNRDWSWLTSLLLLPYGDPALSVAWTLQHELVFYSIFAIAWFTRRMWLLALWGAVCLLPVDMIPFRTINIEFLAGILCFYTTRAGFGSRWLLLIATLPLLIWIVSGADRRDSVLVGISIAVALPCLIRAERRGLTIPRPLIFLGGASYSIYLAHGFAISIAARISPNMIWCFFAGISGGLGYYFLIERNLLKLFAKHIPIGASEPREASRDNP